MSNRLKVLNKQTILQLLKEGNIIKYNTLSAKVYLLDKEKNMIGAVQFNTYLKLKLKEINNKAYYYSFNQYFKLMEV